MVNRYAILAKTPWGIAVVKNRKANVMRRYISNTHQARFFKRSARWCFFVWLVLGQIFVGLADDTGGIARMSVDQVKELLNRPDTVIIDVRTQRNWWRSSKKIQKAVREDPAKVDQWREKYPKDQTLIFYCS